MNFKQSEIAPTTHFAPIAEPAQKAAKYFGKYRGVVQNNSDPMQMGRIIATVPAALGATPSSWALPCVPFVNGSLYAVPPVGTQVWIEFEQGDEDFPVWSGCWAGALGASLFE